MAILVVFALTITIDPKEAKAGLEWQQTSTVIYFQKPLSVNTIRRAICRCQLKLYHAKRKPYVNMVQKRCHVLWAKAHLKWTVSKWKGVLWSDKSKFDILVGNHGRRVLRAKEERDPSSVLSAFSSKASISDGMGVHKCIRVGSLHVLSRTMQNHMLQLLQQHGFVVEESGCWIGLPAVQIFHLLRTFGALLKVP